LKGARFSERPSRFAARVSQIPLIPVIARSNVLLVRQTLAVAALCLIAAFVTAQAPTHRPIIKVTLSIDGESAPCDDLKVELRVGTHIVPVEQVDHGFIVPPIFAKLYASKRTRGKGNLSSSLHCGQYSFDFRGIYPAQVDSGTWELGIGYPPFWLKRQRHADALGTGTWVSFIDFATNTCEPCVEQSLSHKKPPIGVIENLRNKQTKAWGVDAASTAFALAIFGVDYGKNRDYLSELLNSCLSSTYESKLKEVCNDEGVILFLESLYWRGDTGLLNQLLEAADSHAGAVGDIEMFYDDLIEHRPSDALSGMQTLTAVRRDAVCRLAGEDEGRNSARFKTVVSNLSTAHNDIALQCLTTFDASAR
jgi:hypothetical protein